MEFREFNYGIFKQQVTCCAAARLALRF
jgi:hypothetical protein